MMLMLIRRQLQLRWHIFTGSPPSLTITMRSVYLQLHHFWTFSCLRKVKIMVVMENMSEMCAGVIFIKVPHWNYESVVNNLPMGYPILQQPGIPAPGQPHVNSMACGPPGCHIANEI